MNTIIIAEAGVNHNGDIECAKRLIECAADAKADYVKFQTFVAAKIIDAKAKKANYQIENSKDKGETQLQMVKKLELSKEDHEVLIEHCEANNIGFLSTAFDSESVDLLESFGQRIFKIPSGEITNFPLIRQIARIPGKKIISTGMSTIEEIKQAIEVLEKAGTTRSDMIVLHCNTQYPTPMEDVNLRAMNTIKEECNVAIGYSDHTLGIEVPIAAVAMGAQLIEKHFTLDRRMVGPDHAASLEPKELKAMVQSIRNIEQALGDGVKRVSPSEKENIKIARKSVFYNQSLTSGDVITIEHLVMKRPGDGISPSKIDEIVGKIVTSDVHKEAYFKWSDVS